jgi:hypothetical protein
MVSVGPGNCVVAALPFVGFYASNIKLYSLREPRTGKTWFRAGIALPNEEPADAAVCELFDETGLPGFSESNHVEWWRCLRAVI